MAPARRPPPRRGPTARAVAILTAQGFAVVARNTRGDSVYLKPEGCAFALRVSNHARTPKQRKNHPDAITSLVLRDPTSEAALAEAVAVAAAEFFRRAGEAGARGRWRRGGRQETRGSEYRAPLGFY